MLFSILLFCRSTTFLLEAYSTKHLDPSFSQLDDFGPEVQSGSTGAKGLDDDAVVQS